MTTFRCPSDIWITSRLFTAPSDIKMLSLGNILQLCTSVVYSKKFLHYLLLLCKSHLVPLKFAEEAFAWTYFYLGHLCHPLPCFFSRIRWLTVAILWLFVVASCIDWCDAWWTLGIDVSSRHHNISAVFAIIEQAFPICRCVNIFVVWCYFFPVEKWFVIIQL